MNTSNIVPFLLTFTMTIGLTASYEFDFVVSFDGPNEFCSTRDMPNLFRGVESAIAMEGNEFLDTQAVGGIFLEMHLDVPLHRDLLLQTSTEVFTQDNNVEQGDGTSSTSTEKSQRRRLYWGPYGGSGYCMGCPRDNGDGRRLSLRGLSSTDESISKRDASEYIEGELTAYVQRLLASSESSECAASASEWTTTFTWM